MPSSYSTNLKIELQATGENSGTWGTVTNTNLGTALEQAIVGYGNPDYLSDANLTLTYTDTNSAQTARALVLNVTSALSLTGTRELVVPTIQKQYIVQNNTTGGQSITVKTSAGTGITVPNGRKAHLYVNGTDVIYMDDYVDINGGAIDGTPVGANSASTGAFSTLSATGNVNFDGGTFTFNDSGADKDFRVEGDTDANLLFSDASTDRIGIGTNTPASKLDVNGTITATAVNTTTLDLTNLEVTNIKAKDGTSAASIADSTGVVSFTANPILSGGTANGVLYLNGSKVATSGTALVFDGTNLGIGTSSPSSFSSLANEFVVNGSTSVGITISESTGAGTSNLLFAATSSFPNRGNISYDHTASALTFGINATEAMRLTSSTLYTASGINVGIGTSSPTQKLHVAGNILSLSAAGTDSYINVATNTVQNTYVGFNNSGSTNAAGALNNHSYFGSGNAYGIQFITNGSAAATINTSGNLGIGTSSPSARLHVKDATGTAVTLLNLESGYSNPSGNKSILWTDATNALGRISISYTASTGSTMSFGSLYNGGYQTSDLMVLTNTGNLGLGVTPSAWRSTNPAFQIGQTGSVFAYSSSNIVGFGNNVFIDSAGNEKYIATATAGYYRINGNAHQWFNAASGTAGNTISFTQAMTLDASGNLEIGGTVSLGRKLTVNSSTDGYSMSLFQSGAYNSGKLAGTVYAGYYDGTSITDMASIRGGKENTTSGNYAGMLSFYTRVNGGSDTERARITSGGDLLVGDTANSAGARLYVKGSGATSGSVAMVVRNSTPSDLLYIRNDGYMTFGISPAMTLTAGGDLLVGTTTYQSKRITIDGGSGGAVWANCSTSANPVNVTYNTATSGDNLFEEFYTDGGVLRGTISYNRGAGQVSYNVTSDARLKDNIADAADAGNKVDALQVRQFDWKETGNHVDYGFIAQELHEVAPQAVSKPEDDEKMWSVDYSKLVPMLVKEIQSLRARVAQLESK